MLTEQKNYLQKKQFLSIPKESFYTNFLILIFKKFVSSHLKTFLPLLLEREREKYRCERETSIGCLQYKFQLGTEPQPSMCPDPGFNWQPLALQDAAGTNWATPARAVPLTLTNIPKVNITLLTYIYGMGITANHWTPTSQPAQGCCLALNPFHQRLPNLCTSHVSLRRRKKNVASSLPFTHALF